MATASASASSVLLSAHLRVAVVIPSQSRFHPPVSSSINLNRFATLELSTAAAPSPHHRGRLYAASLEAYVSAEADSSSEAARRLYIGNIPRTVDNAELTGIVSEHGAVEKAEVMYDKYSGRSRRFAFVMMKTVDDAVAVAEKLNGTQIGGREIKVNVTEKPLTLVDLSLLQAEESQFIDSPHKVYVGNLAKSVTTETLKQFFSQNGNVISAKVSRIPGTSKPTGFGFVTFSSAEEVEAAISSCNDVMLEGQKVRVNKA